MQDKPPEEDPRQELELEKIVEEQEIQSPDQSMFARGDESGINTQRPKINLRKSKIVQEEPVNMNL